MSSMNGSQYPEDDLGQGTLHALVAWWIPCSGIEESTWSTAAVHASRAVGVHIVDENQFMLLSVYRRHHLRASGGPVAHLSSNMSGPGCALDPRHMGCECWPDRRRWSLFGVQILI
jgi:hypothetical protein